MTYVSLGILKRSQGKFEEAETLSPKALNIYREALGPDDRNIGTIQSDLAGMYLYMERLRMRNGCSATPWSSMSVSAVIPMTS